MNRTGGKVQFAARFVFMRLFVVCKFVYSYLKNFRYTNINKIS